jgi:phage baseplate assembly protein W
MSTLNEFYGTDVAFKSDLVRTATGDVDTISGLENVKNAIFRRIMTSKGSIIHRPNYGVGLKNYQNALASLAVQRKIAGEIKEQLEQDPRIEKVSSVGIKVSSTNPGLFEINLNVKLVGYGEKQMKFVPTIEV